MRRSKTLLLLGLLVLPLGCIQFPGPALGTDLDDDTVADSADSSDSAADVGADHADDVPLPPFSCATCPFGCDEDRCIEVVEVSAGGDSTCARTSDGALYCWGDQASAQTPTGLTMLALALPSRIPDLPPVDAVTVGSRHGCALTDTGELRCWGDLRRTSNVVRVPTAVELPAQAGADAGHWETTCAWNVESVLCWGTALDGSDSDLGVSKPQYLPLTVGGLAGAPEIERVTVGRMHACALLAGGDVWCWGDGGLGQLGTGTQEDHLGATPVFEVLDGRVSGISAGNAHVCALVDSGAEVHCWGDNRENQLAQATAAQFSVPKSVALASGRTWVDVTSGAAFSCALDQGGEVWCWGANQRYQLGTSGVARAASPMQVLGLPAMRSIDAGREHVCGIGVAGGVWCWGDDQLGQLGDGGSIGSASETPLQVRFEAAQSVLTPCTDFGAAHPTRSCEVCAPHGDAGIYVPCPFGCSDGTCATASTTVSGTEHACALLNDGEVWCWGRPRDGQLGDGTVHGNDIFPPRRAELSQPATQLASGDLMTCARLDDGSVHCWGSNKDGQLGIGSESPALSALPLQVDLGGLATDLAAQKKSACAVLESSSLACWGWSLDGQGYGGSTDDLAPRYIDPLPPGTLSGLAVGGSVACVVAEQSGSDDGLYCWGTSISGHFAAGEEYATGTPELVMARPDIRQVVLGSSHVCVSWGATDLTIECWASNFAGQLGDAASFKTEVIGPSVDVTSQLPSAIGAIAAGSSTTCASDQDDAVWCWGNTGLGEDGWQVGAPAGPTPRRVDGVFGTPSLRSVNACAVDTFGFVRCWSLNNTPNYRVGLQQGSPAPQVPPLIGAFAP